MTRYIDPEELKANLGEPPENWTSSDEEIQALNDFYMFQTLIDAQPTADVVEVVRCKDCKYASPNGLYGCLLERFSAHDQRERLFSEDYCSAAERREDA